jgi:hypothetical protein
MRQSIKKAVVVLTVVAAFAAIAAPAASARFDLNSSNDQPAQPATPVYTIPASSADSSSGFDWGDATIGASIALALVALGGGVVLMSRRTQAKSRPATTS